MNEQSKMYLMKLSLKKNRKHFGGISLHQGNPRKHIETQIVFQMFSSLISVLVDSTKLVQPKFVGKNWYSRLVLIA